MLYLDALAFVVELALLVYCVLDVLRTPAPQVRTLPKPVWLLLAVFPPVLGPISWLVLGRPQRAPSRPAPAPPIHPDDDEAFLRRLRERAEEQRRRGRDEDA